MSESPSNESGMLQKVKKIARITGYIIGGLFFLYLCIEFNFLWLFGKVPSLKELENPPIELASELYTADGVLLGRYYKENRTQVPYGKISPYFIKALIATEDVRFFEHSGVDFSATFSIVWYMMKGDKRGGSTITQQLAKNLFKTRQKDAQGLLGYIPGIKTFIFKMKEWIVAVKLERSYSKVEILRLYMNTVDFGSNSFGVKSAARTFFDTTPDSLNIQQAAMLVGMLKAPTLYSPVLHPKNALNRRNTVISQMVRYKIITDQVADSISKLPIVLTYKVDNQLEGDATYLRGIIGKFLKKWCDKHGYDLYSDGLKIYTTLDSKLQHYGEEAVQEHMSELQHKFFNHWKGENPWIDENKKEIPNFIEDAVKLTPVYRLLRDRFSGNRDSINLYLNKPKKMSLFSYDGELRDTMMSTMDSLRYYKKFLHAGFMMMDPFTGEIKVWVGGVNYKYFKYDHVFQSKRQPGSTFKPFVYCAALDKGYSPCQKLVDRPITITYEEDGQEKVWSPRNSDWVFTGDSMTLRRAMAKSVNTITAQLTLLMTPDTVVRYAHRCGIMSPIKSVPSVGLGSSDVSLYEMVGAYGTFMNKGEWIEPIFVTKIVDIKGRTIVEFKPKKRKAIAEETAFLMVHMLKGGLEEPGGTGQGLFSFDLFHGNELGGKTGTSTNHSDGWFMGITKQFVGGVWVGAEDRSVHFKTSAMGEGMRTALPIWGKFLEKAYRDKTSGVKMGYFPRTTVPIKVKYQCTTRLPRKDTLATDSTEYDEGNVPLDGIPVESNPAVQP